MNSNNQSKIKDLSNSELKIILNPEFKKKVFKELLKKYKFDKLPPMLNISRGMIYNYKNDRTKSVPLPMFEKAKNLLNLNNEEIKNNTINILKSEEIRDKGLILGRELRIKKVKDKFKTNFSIIDLLKKKEGILTLNLVEWLEKSNWINKIKTQSGIIRNVKNAQIFDDHIRMEYEAYKKNKGFEKYVTYLPKNIILDNDFFYFLGLRFGDGTNGARVGIANKNYHLIKFSFNFLKKLFPNSRIHMDLCFYKKLNATLVQNIMDKFRDISDNIDICHYDTGLGNYVFYVYVTNKIFSRILDGFVKNFEDLFKILTFEQKGDFLAGFFEAEGNINKLDGNLRFSQKIKRNVEIISNLLINEGYHIRYDGGNIVIAYKQEYHKNDLDLFKRQILPFIISPNTRKEINDVINSYLIRDDYKEIVEIISQNPGINQREISDKIRRKKSNAKLKALLDAGYIKKEGKTGETFKYEVTSPGLKWIGVG